MAKVLEKAPHLVSPVEREEAGAELRRRGEKIARSQMKGRKVALPTLARMVNGDVVFDHDAEFDRRVVAVVEDGEVRKVAAIQRRTGFRAVPPLDRMYTRQQITERQFTTGDALRKVMSLAGTAPKVVMFGANGGGAGETDGFTAARLDALRSRARALATVGKVVFSLLEHVLHHDGDAGTWEGVKHLSRARASQHGMRLLKEALDKLGAKKGD